MVSRNVRPYEISLWTLQDSFITVLKPLGVENRGQIETPKMTLKDDGTQELKFSLPMYYREDGKLVENHIWYTVKEGMLIENLRKLKVIFHKGEEGEEIYEFVITKVKEKHSDGQLMCDIEASGLAFEELGKVGYKISLDQIIFEEEYEKWWLTPEEERGPEPIMSLQYWADKVFENSDWTYSIQMDWSSFAGGERASNIVYEDEFISSWEDGESGLVPVSMAVAQEKARPIKIEKSNKYNITQTLAETFGVHCKYKYHYDTNYHITGRECIFYNNFLEEREGAIDINYPYDSSKIEREKDSTDIITKMFVVSQSGNSEAGLITIADAAANKTREDYILNFDYLYNIGTISQEQYDAIADYERKMYNLNVEIEPIASQIAKLQLELVEWQAKKTLATEGQTQDKEQMEQASKLLDAITGGTARLYKNLDNPYRGVLLPSEGNRYYIKLTTEGIYDGNEAAYDYPKKEGSGQPSLSGIHLWCKQDNGNNGYEYSEITGFTIDKDANGNVVSLSNIELRSNLFQNLKIYYATFAYLPQLQYKNIYNTYATQLAIDEATEREATARIEEIETKLEELEQKHADLIDEKNYWIADFENMMGPALREGSWQADTYTDYSTKLEETVSSSGGASSSDYLHFTWDDEPFDEEQLNYFYEQTQSGGIMTKTYYPMIVLDNASLAAIKDDLKKISLRWEDSAIPNSHNQMTINSEMFFGFMRHNTTKVVSAILILTGNLPDGQLERIKQNGRICVITTEMGDDFNVVVEEKVLVNNAYIGEEGNWISNADDYTYVFPRLVIESLSLNTSDDALFVKNVISATEKEELEKYYDFYVLARDDKNYITIKNDVMVRQGTIDKMFDVSYEISRAALSLYLDALEVSKTNAFPQVSYTVDMTAFNESFIGALYNKLNRVVNINDTELKLNNVHGYISELNLNLENPWEDKITIQNYKTKFEDLFSSIVASTEQMKSNSFVYNTAANAFTGAGTLKQSVIQETLNKVDLTYAFQGGSLTIDEVNGIWARSDDGVVAMRGGGIFCASKTDSYGNWIWNTGILPSGINASLITAGQLDTNLVRIFAGDDLRLQMNADGLFAYGVDPITEEAIPTSYVVHNKDGLFLHKDGVDCVEISWDGLIIRNNGGEKVFFADNEGNLSLTGNISAATGNIGNWTITDEGLIFQKLSDGGNSIVNLAGLAPAGSDRTGNSIFWVNGENGVEFKVSDKGTVWCNDIIAKGSISAGSLIGRTIVDEIDDQMRNISIAVLDGTTFTFDNPNYDGEIVKSPSELKFRIYTNALTAQELTDSQYVFKYRNPDSSPLEDWVEIPSTLISWDVNYLTFIVKSDIMYMGGSTPKDRISIMVSKAGKLRTVNESGDYDYNTQCSYTDDIMLVSEITGLSKLIGAITPSDWNFAENETSKIFSIAASGFSKEELSQGEWKFRDNTISATVADDGSSSSIAINKTDIPENTSSPIYFTIDRATRMAMCSNIVGGADGMNIVMRSSSGSVLTDGDTSTDLSIEVYIGTALMAPANYYYVWRKDGVVLSSLTIRNEDNTTSTIAAAPNNDDFFRQSTIVVSADDFGLKSDYRCDVYNDLDSAKADYNGSGA